MSKFMIAVLAIIFLLIVIAVVVVLIFPFELNKMTKMVIVGVSIFVLIILVIIIEYRVKVREVKTIIAKEEHETRKAVIGRTKEERVELEPREMETGEMEERVELEPRETAAGEMEERVELEPQETAAREMEERVESEETEEELAKLMRENQQSSCPQGIRFSITENNKALFNMFIIFMSGMTRLATIVHDSIKKIAEALCGFPDIDDSVEYMNNLLLSPGTMKEFKTINFENVFRLLRIQDPVKDRRRPYALDELKANLALLEVINFNKRSHEYFDFVYKTLSDKVSEYSLSRVDIQHHLNYFLRYLEKFRIKEILSPEENLYLIREIVYFIRDGKVQFGSLSKSRIYLSRTSDEGISKVIDIPENKPRYIFVILNPEGLKPEKRVKFDRFDKFELEGYKMRAIIFKVFFMYFSGGTSREEIENIVILVRDKVLCVVTAQGKEVRESIYIKPTGETISHTIQLVRNSGFIIGSSYEVPCVMYELIEATRSSEEPEISKSIEKPISLVSGENFNDMMDTRKRLFRTHVMDEFINNYGFKVSRDTRIFQVIFHLLEFIKICTGDVGKDNGVIKSYLFPSANKKPDKLFIAPFIERVIEDFFKIEYFDLTFDEKSPEEIWNSVVVRMIEFYKKDSAIAINVLLKNAVEVMKLFTHILPSVSLEELGKDQRIHSDYILATIYLIKRLWKIYDACLMVMKLLAEKSMPNEEEKLLQYLLIKFNTLIYIKCYFVSFSDDSKHDEDLNKKRLEFERYISDLKLDKPQ